MGERLSIFIGQPIYSLKDICLRDDPVEKIGIFGIQKRRFAQKGT